MALSPLVNLVRREVSGTTGSTPACFVNRGFGVAILGSTSEDANLINGSGLGPQAIFKRHLSSTIASTITASAFSPARSTWLRQRKQIHGRPHKAASQQPYGVEPARRRHDVGLGRELALPCDARTSDSTNEFLRHWLRRAGGGSVIYNPTAVGDGGGKCEGGSQWMNQSQSDVVGTGCCVYLSFPKLRDQAKPLPGRVSCAAGG